jgi:hypothetical protein
VVRTQIQLTEQQARRLRAQAHQQSVSVAELIRRFVDRGLIRETTDRDRLYQKATRVIGRFPDRRGATNLALDHDRYLDEAFE